MPNKLQNAHNSNVKYNCNKAFCSSTTQTIPYYFYGCVWSIWRSLAFLIRSFLAFDATNFAGVFIITWISLAILILITKADRHSFYWICNWNIHSWAIFVLVEGNLTYVCVCACIGIPSKSNSDGKVHFSRMLLFFKSILLCLPKLIKQWRIPLAHNFLMCVLIFDDMCSSSRPFVWSA